MSMSYAQAIVITGGYPPTEEPSWSSSYDKQFSSFCSAKMESYRIKYIWGFAVKRNDSEIIIILRGIWSKMSIEERKQYQ